MPAGDWAIRKKLEDELERNAHDQRALREEKESLPRGSIVVKQKNGKRYSYLQYRSGGKVKSKYLGVEGKSDAEVKEMIARRKQVEEELRNLQEEQDFIERALALK